MDLPSFLFSFFRASGTLRLFHLSITCNFILRYVYFHVKRVQEFHPIFLYRRSTTTGSVKLSWGFETSLLYTIPEMSLQIGD